MHVHMKRFFTAMLALLLLFAMVPTTAYAAGNTVYFDNTPGWETVYYYYWPDSGSASVTWPGIPMTHEGGSVYSAEVPVDIRNVIFNCGKGGTVGREQTADLIVPGDGYIYSMSGGWAVFGGCAHEWGNETYVAPPCLSATTVQYTCRLCGETSTAAVSKVDHLYVGDSCTYCGGAKPEDYLLYFENTLGWEALYCHYWIDYGEGTDWPGVPMTHVGGDIYSVTVPYHMENVIFNCGEGGYIGQEQTADLPIPGTGYLYSMEDGWEIFTGCVHSWDAGTLIKAPDCEDVGVMRYRCTLCGTTDDKVMDRLSHQYVDDLCTLCGKPKPKDRITVYVKAPVGWTNVHLYYWTTDTVNSMWPGDPMTFNGEWWEAEISAEYDNVIFNNGNEKQQSVDIALDPGQDAWVVYGLENGLYYHAGTVYDHIPTKADLEEKSWYVTSGICGEYARWLLQKDGVLNISGIGDMKLRSFTTDAGLYWHGFYGIVTEVNVEEGITSVDENAFSYCDALRAASLPASLRTVGDYAFGGCDDLQVIRFAGGAPSISADAFYGVNAVAYYPSDHASWAESVRKNYGGNITWIGYESDHDYDEGVIVSAPDCIRSGMIRYTCRDCDAVKQEIIPATGHNFSEGACTACGATRPELRLTGATSAPGKEFTVDLYLHHNPGLGQLRVGFDYDSSALTLVSVKNKATGVSMVSGNSYIWSKASGFTNEGVLATVTFRINSGASEGVYEILPVCGEALDRNGNAVSVAEVFGQLYITSMVPGDANGDGTVSDDDLALLDRFLAQKDPVTGASPVTIAPDADINGDGTIDTADRSLLAAMLNQLPGDVTGDGKLNIMDVVKLYAHVKGIPLTDPGALSRADVSGDGKVNIMDVVKLYAHVKGVSRLF